MLQVVESLKSAGQARLWFVLHRSGTWFFAAYSSSHFAFCLGRCAGNPPHRQNLTLEGQTGGFLTPTAYVVYAEKGQFFSHPAVGFHFIDASAVIGNVETFSVTEGFANRAEVGYTRSVHQYGDQPTATATPLGLSNLWNYSGMNVFHGKVVGIKDGQFAAWMPGIAVGGLVRTNDHFLSGAANKMLTGTDKSYTNGDVYVAVTKTWAKPPVPFLLNLGWKATNATIFGIGGQSTRFGGRFFGGLGIPLPIGHGIVAVPSAGFTQEPKTSVNLNTLLNAALYQCEAETRLQPCVVPADELPYTHNARLRGARDAEGQAALRVRYRCRTGGGKHRIDLCPKPLL